MKRITPTAAGIFIGLMAVIMAGCGSGKQEEIKVKKPPMVEATPVVRGKIVETLDTTGEVVAVDTVTIMATVEGPIAYCPWREGDVVDVTGQKLIEINRPTYEQEVLAAEAALAVARAKLADLNAGARPEEIAQAAESARHFEHCTRYAKIDYERIQALVESGALPGEEAEKARVGFTRCETQLMAAREQLTMLKAGPTQTEIAIAQAQTNEASARLGLAKAKFEECFLTAPFAGVITRVFVRPGDLVSPRAPLLEMMEATSLAIRFAVPEAQAIRVRQGARVTVSLDAYPEQTFEATIDRIYPDISRDTRTRLAEARVTDSATLFPGQFARLSVELYVVEDALLVPEKAVLSTTRGDAILFVVEENRAVERQVDLGMEQNQLIQIIQGVQESEWVVFAGNEGLKTGMQVEMKKDASEDKTDVLPVPAARNDMRQPASRMRQVMMKEKFPVYIQEYEKAGVRFATLDGLCQHVHECIEKDPEARYIGTFDHYTHTRQLTQGVIAPEIKGAKMILFCFGEKLMDPRVLALRPRSIGIAETDSQFVIAFLEPPTPEAVNSMERWVSSMANIADAVYVGQPGDSQ